MAKTESKKAREGAATRVLDGPAPRLVGVRLDGGELVCRFEEVREVRASLEALGIPARPRIVGVAPDEFGGAVVIRRADGTVEDCGADYVLYVNEPGYDPAADARYRLALQGRIAGRLKARREQRGVTQKEMAKRLGIARPNYSRMESGKHMPDFSVLLRAAQILGVSLDFFVAKTRKPPVAEPETSTGQAPGR